MRPKLLTRQKHTAIIIVSLIVMFLLSNMTLKAQTTKNFSGKWDFDKSKSSPELKNSKYEGTVTRQITQNSSTLSYCDIYILKGNDDWKTSDELFNLDGKEQIQKDDSNTIKKSAKWSQDNLTLTLTYINTYIEEGVSKDLLITESYKQSDDGKTLTIETYSKNVVTGESKTKSVYHKK